jgi:hypothetical protein
MLPKLYLLNRLLDKKTKLCLYYAWIESSLRYGIEVYGLTYSTDLDRLQKVQNKTLKTLFRNLNLKTRDLYKNLKILNIKNLCDYVIVVNNYFHRDFRKDTAHKTNLLRNTTYRYDVMRPKNDMGKRNRNYKIPMLFNSLPITLIGLEGKTIMKHEILNYFISEQ